MMEMVGNGMVEDEEGIESHSKSFVFMVSDLSDQQMKQMEEATAMLGGRIASDPATFDPLATHLVTCSVAQTEKVVMAPPSFLCGGEPLSGKVAEGGKL